MDVTFAARTLGALAVIVAVLSLLAYLAKAGTFARIGVAGGRRLVTVIETTVLPGGATVHVVSVAGEYLLLGRTNGSVTTLSDLSKESVDSWLAAGELSSSSAGWIARARRRRRLST